MAINLYLLGSKLARYREQLQEGFPEVSRATGISPSRLEQIELGQVQPTGDEILILADHYRCDFKFFISNELVAPFEETETLYRAYGRDFSKEDRRAVQDFLYLCETEDFLMRGLGRAPGAFATSVDGRYFKAHAEKAAAKLRAQLGYGDRAVPRDVYADFRNVGVHVFRRKLGNSKISGLFINHPVAGKCALVNYSEDVYRQRFSAAHEMAHAIFDSDQAVSVSFEQPDRADLLEVRANRFASCYLMPPAFLSKLPNPREWGRDDALHWANELRVSCQALAIALREAKLIDGGMYGWMSRLRVPSQEKIDPELPDSLSPMERERKAKLLELGLSDHYVALCFDAYNSELISQSRLAEALLCTDVELSELASLYGRALNGH